MNNSFLFTSIAGVFQSAMQLKPAQFFAPGKRTHNTGTNKCKNHGHLYSNVLTHHDKNNQLLMTGKCRRCGHVSHYMPAKVADFNLHRSATKKSRKHWLKKRLIAGVLYVQGKTAEQQP